uniref:DHC_N2 domain-containing protein n=1 Tax=Strongyloides papillosus TaxID=174720 RepID=A0A0N5BER4_STREA
MTTRPIKLTRKIVNIDYVFRSLEKTKKLVRDWTESRDTKLFNLQKHFEIITKIQDIWQISLEHTMATPLDIWQISLEHTMATPLL